MRNTTRQTEGRKSTVHHVAEILLKQPRLVKQLILMTSDYLVSIVLLFLALSIRLGVLDVNASFYLIAAYALVPVIGLYLVGFYNNVTRIFSDTNMRRVIWLFVGMLVLFAIFYLAEGITSLPRSVPLLHLFMFFIWLWSSRLIIRGLLLRNQRKPTVNSTYKTTKTKDNVIIYGAGSSGTELLKALRHSPRYHVVGFVDDDPSITGGRILSKKIYPAARIKDLVEEQGIEQVFLAMPSVSPSRRRNIIDQLTQISIKIKQLPSLMEIAEGRVTVSTMRNVDILDVLERQIVEPDSKLLKTNIAGKAVLVTGAGGSIGSELCRQIIKNQPKCLVLYELSEYALYAIHQELTLAQANKLEAHRVPIVAIMGNVQNESKLYNVFTEYSVNTVYHAAAYKHVPLVEHNPFEGMINNTKGTYHCVQAAVKASVDTFVLISTDKAVRPTNVMGASKRMAELVCQAFAQQITDNSANESAQNNNTFKSVNTRISMVRFGNVLGSSGSVVPLFKRQIAQGGPITVTHPEVTRYFMTIPEAANLVIQAGAMAQGGEVFVLDMGESVKIIDLAKRMVHLSGNEIRDDDHPNGDIEIKFTGLRPGEKLYEELIIDDNNIETTAHPLIMQACEHSFSLIDIVMILNELAARSQQNDVRWLKRQFSYFVEGYNPNT